ncbi:MAG TPA: TatD family hydrolase [Steroidobacteraceae bacterium]|nr:TatD family hydrolase [Steroidobacteraceae bacterium]
MKTSTRCSHARARRASRRSSSPEPPSTKAGVHPHHARECEVETIPALRALASHPRVVAIGECGLDFNRNYSPHPDQEKWFEAQLELACEIAKPLFLHRATRSRTSPSYCDRAAVGCRAQCATARSRHLLDLVREIPPERLLIETDSPYLTPRDLHPQPRAPQRAGIPSAHRTDHHACARPAGR